MHLRPVVHSYVPALFLSFLTFSSWVMPTAGGSTLSSYPSYGTTNDPECSGSFLRQISPSNQLGSQEASYWEDRSRVVETGWSDWLGDPSELGYDISTGTTDHPSNVGLAAGGDGLRGALFTEAILAASLPPSHTSKREEIGIGQFIPPLTGNSVNAGAVIIQEGALVAGPRLFRRQAQNSFHIDKFLDLDLLNPAGSDILVANNQRYHNSVLQKAYAKASQGLQPSLVDIWSNMLAYHFFNATTLDNFYNDDTAHGTDLLWTDVVDIPRFKGRQIPFPIVTIATQNPSNGDVDEVASWGQKMVYEVTPYEMGSHDSRLNAMTPTKYLGTHAMDGKPQNDQCVTGFDQASYLAGTSSSPLYNSNDGSKPDLSAFDTEGQNTFNYLMGNLTNQTQSRRYDVGNWPNPFRKSSSQPGFSDWNEDWLSLGGSQNYLPIEQLMVKSRNISTIIAADATGEHTNNKWPDGTALRIASNRVTSLLNETHQAFPPIPDDFANTGVTLRPTFFGCDPVKSPPEYPLIIYIPNAPPADGSDPVTNPSGFKTSYSQNHQDVFAHQSALSVTSGFLPNATGPDPQYPTCFKCAIVDRARLAAQNPVERSDVCKKCFSQYCYDPQSRPSANAIVGRKLVFTDPDLKSEGLLKNEGISKRHGVQNGVQIGIGAAVGVVAVIAIAVAFIFWRRRKQGIKRRGGISPPINIGTGGKYTPLRDGEKVWSDLEGSTNQQYYEMGTTPQHAHYTDPYVDDPSSGLTPTAQHHHYSSGGL